jgi:uncharacterized protein (TIGR00255 family)
MTGFAKQNGELVFDDLSFNWSFELKSVNGKSIDIKVKSPSWLGDISIQLKTILSKYFSRGSFGVYLDVNSENSNQKIRINEDLLSQLIERAIEIYNKNQDGFAKPTAGELLNAKGVIEVEDSMLGDENMETFQKTLFDSFEEGCKSLRESRLLEGAKIKTALMDILAKVEAIIGDIENISKNMPEKLKEKLRQQISSMLDTNVNITEDRIAQEVVFYVAKADIQEEIDRLKAHIKTATELLASKEAVGRKLDFLCQELNREANTTCSKSVDINITNYGMELKTLIEQFREQIQNIE